MRTVVVALVVALVSLLTTTEGTVAEYAIATPSKSAGGHDPAKHEPKPKEEIPRKAGEKSALRLLTPRMPRTAQQPRYRHVPAASRITIADDIATSPRAEHLCQLTEPPMLQVFRN